MPESDYAEVYLYRGMAHIIKGDYDRAIKDFVEANKRDQELISKNVFCYIASQVDPADTDMFRHLVELYFAISKIKELLIYKPSENPGLIAHYTDLDSLKALAQDPSFRLYNATYMSDPEEGETLLEALKLPNQDDTAKGFLSGSARSPAYIGSFVKTSEKHGDEKLFLWRTYGKHKGQEAGGACLHFDISQFSDRPPDQLEGMHSISSGHSGPALRIPQREYIYKIAYKGYIESDRKLKRLLENLAKTLNDIKGQGWNKENTNHQLAREILDEIRFLFKADHYREEEELRIVKFSGEPTEDVKVDNYLLPPRFYMEAPPQLELKKIILGPQARGFSGWKWWIEEERRSKLEVEKSDIEYGGDYS